MESLCGEIPYWEKVRNSHCWSDFEEKSFEEEKNNETLQGVEWLHESEDEGVLHFTSTIRRKP